MTVVVIGANTGDDYSGVEDTRLRSDNATTNYGTAVNTSAASSYFGVTDSTLIRFTGISNITGPVTVSSATMSLYENQFQGTSPMAATVHRNKRAWVEAEATHNIYSTGNNWETAGALGTNDIDTTPIASPSLTSTNGYQSITGLAQDFEDWINGTYSNEGHKIAGNEANDRWFCATSNGTDGQRPYVTIDYTASSSDSADLESDATATATFAGALAIASALSASSTASATWVGQATVTSDYQISSLGSQDWVGASGISAAYTMTATGEARWRGEAAVQADVWFDVNSSGLLEWDSANSISAEYTISPAATVEWVGQAAADGAADFSISATAEATFVSATTEGAAAEIAATNTTEWTGSAIITGDLSINSVALAEWIGSTGAPAPAPAPSPGVSEEISGGGAGLWTKKRKKKQEQVFDDDEVMAIIAQALPILVQAYRR